MFDTDLALLLYDNMMKQYISNDFLEVFFLFASFFGVVEVSTCKHAKTPSSS